MYSEQLIAAVRQTAYLGDGAAFPQYTDARVLDELNDKLNSVYSDLIVKARAGYWLKETIFSTTVGRSRYRIPPRSVVGGLEKVEVSPTGTSFVAASQVPASVAQQFESAAPGTPTLYTIQGDQIDFFPTPSTVLSIRLTYYIRPSRLVTSQSQGHITSIAAGARQIVVNAEPYDYSLGVPAAITSGQQAIDIVHPDGWHELALVSAPQTFAGLVITLGGAADLSDIAVGDYVRVADQTDWPALPDDFHRSLADVTAAKILLQLSMVEKAGAIAESASNDIERFKGLLQPRVRSEPKVIGCRPFGGRRY